MVLIICIAPLLALEWVKVSGPMSFLQIFTLFASSVTIFGLIVAIFSVYNGRMTRREIGGLIRETQELIAREAEATRQLLRETQELIAREAEAARRILQGITEILGRIDERVR